MLINTVSSMTELIECVPNFSVGNNQKILDQIVSAIAGVSGIVVLDQESDPAHNRSVVTFVGSAYKVSEAAFQATKVAAKLINLDHHKGEHPRMGATDVIPLIPISGISEENAIELARLLGKRIGSELGIPVYMYEKAALNQQRVNLADIRKGEYEALKKEMGKKKERDPDYGPRKVGTAGATAVGVRDPLIAYNVNLDTDDISMAKQIASKVRFKDGGFPFVKALGFYLKDRGIAQVSMNLTNFNQTSIPQVFEFIKAEAASHGVKVLESEIVGLVPEKALLDAAKHYLQLKKFSFDQVLELKLKSCGPAVSYPLDDFILSVASKNPTPGGGSVAALSGSLASALMTMVSNLTLGNSKYKKFDKEITKLKYILEIEMNDLKGLIYKDIEAYNLVVKASKMPKTSVSEIKQRGVALKGAYLYAAEVPMLVAKKSFSLLDFLERLVLIGNRNALSDVGVAALLIQAAVRGAIFNVKINLRYLKNSKVQARFAKTIKRLEKQIDHKVVNLLEMVNRSLL